MIQDEFDSAHKRGSFDEDSCVQPSPIREFVGTENYDGDRAGQNIFGNDRDGGIGWTEVSKPAGDVLPVHECCGKFPNRRPYAVNNGAQQCCEDGLIVSAYLPCP